MNYEKTFLCFFISFFLNSVLFSQFKEGYIIENNDDTIYGYIDFEGAIKNSDHCTFKSNQDSTIHVYYPGDIKAFRYTNGKYFITSEIPVNNKPQKVFLEWLIKGRASILTYSPSDMQVKYFILLENDSLFELQNTSLIRGKKISESFTETYKIEKREYIGMLHYYFKDCPSISSTINTTSLSSKSLIKVAKQYHEKTCDTESCIVFEDKNRRLKADVGITFSSLNSQLILKNEIPEKVYPTDSWGYGLSFKISNLPLLSPKFSIRSQFLYSNLFFTYDTEGLYWGDDNRICKYSFIRIPLQISYKFLHYKISPYISAGGNANIRFGYSEYDKLLLNYITKHYNYIYGVTVFQFGANAGIGLEYIITPKVSIDLALEYERSFSFFGTFNKDKSYLTNYFIQVSVLYKLD